MFNTIQEPYHKLSLMVLMFTVKKTQRHVESVKIMINHSGGVFQPYISKLREKNLPNL